MMMSSLPQASVVVEECDVMKKEWVSEKDQSKWGVYAHSAFVMEISLGTEAGEGAVMV
jgi:hypothetical protein